MTMVNTMKVMITPQPVIMTKGENLSERNPKNMKAIGLMALARVPIMELTQPRYSGSTDV